MGCAGAGWQGATTPLATASKEAQRSQRGPERLNRVRSVFTAQAKHFKAKNIIKLLLKYRDYRLAILMIEQLNLKNQRDPLDKSRQIIII